MAKSLRLLPKIISSPQDQIVYMARRSVHVSVLEMLVDP